MGASPIRRQMACPQCGTKAEAILRFGDLRPRSPRPPTLEMQNHFPPTRYQKLCDVSETAIPTRDWPTWATDAVTKVRGGR